MTKALRDTKQRHAIKRAFEQSGRPLSPKEVLDISSSEVPNIGIATVYRNINVMVKNGELDVIELPGQPPRYALPQNEKPALFLCEKTNRVFHINEENMKVDLPALPEGFKVNRFEVIIYGDSPESATADATTTVAQPATL